MCMGQLLPSLSTCVGRFAPKFVANSHVSRAENAFAAGGSSSPSSEPAGGTYSAPRVKGRVKRVGGKRDEGRVRERVKGETADGQERREDVPKGGDELCPLAHIPAGANRAISSKSK